MNTQYFLNGYETATKQINPASERAAVLKYSFHSFYLMLIYLVYHIFLLLLIRVLATNEIVIVSNTARQAYLTA